MLFVSWWTNRRRRRLLATPFPEEWLTYLHRNVPLYDLLTEAEQAKLRDDLRIFIAEKNWEGCAGQPMTDEVKVTIAAQACLLVLAIDHDYFSRVQTILVYPSGYRAPESDVGRLGEAWYRGPVVLGWQAVLVGGQNYRDGHNVVLHEFAHQLDFLDGFADGTPPLHSQEQYRRWHEVMTAAYDRLVEETEHGKVEVLDEYGATNPAEFFAVATECFFEKPLQLRRHHPDLYEVLRDYYCQDPAGRLAPEEASPPVHKVDIHHHGLLLYRQHRPYRGSRAAPLRHPAEEEARDWPAWVRFWDLHPGRPRSYARMYLRRQVVLLLALAGCAALDMLATGKFGTGPLFVACFSLLLLSTALWLWLAMRWVDRHGRWARRPTPEKP